jgi:2-polyprenyl-6-methoxyphenol hydroxylase-like FAD-dependent oxidoreductase
MNALTKVFPDIYNLRNKEASRGFNLVSPSLNRWMQISLAPGMAISRPLLRKMLMEGLDVRFSKTFARYEETKDYVVGYFEDGSDTGPVDLLVGADGARSRVRKARIPNLKHEPIGVISVNGITRAPAESIPKLNAILENGFTRVFNNHGTTLLIMKVTDNFPDEVLWCITFRSALYPSFPNQYDKDLEKEEQQALYKWSVDHVQSTNYHPEVRNVVQTADISTLMTLRELHSVVPLPGDNPLAPSTRVTLLGDSAHAMTTHSGRGANTSFEDCVDLANMISTAGQKEDWKGSLHEYEKILFKRGFKNVNQSKGMSYMITLSGWRAWLRNFFIYLMGCIMFIRGLFIRNKHNT